MHEGLREPELDQNGVIGGQIEPEEAQQGQNEAQSDESTLPKGGVGPRGLLKFHPTGKIPQFRGKYGIYHVRLL